VRTSASILPPKFARSGKRPAEPRRYAHRMKNITRLLLPMLLLGLVTAEIAGGQTLTNNPKVPNRVSIISIGVTNLAKSITFYRDTLGLRVTSQSEEVATLSASTVDLLLSAPLGTFIKPATASIEIIFPVESVVTAHKLLTEKGCEFLRPPREVIPGSWAATFKDPDGHLLTVLGGK
jgi:catechol 2,3-dioxygenase-like lactoylglutathione lyase family enzyme